MVMFFTQTYVNLLLRVHQSIVATEQLQKYMGYAWHLHFNEYETSIVLCFQLFWLSDITKCFSLLAALPPFVFKFLKQTEIPLCILILFEKNIQIIVVLLYC